MLENERPLAKLLECQSIIWQGIKNMKNDHLALLLTANPSKLNNWSNKINAPPLVTAGLRLPIQVN